MNNYLIPANTKRGTLIFGMFRPADLIIFGIGIGTTFLAIMIFQNLMNSTAITVACIAPAVISGVLVAPVPYYHNVLNVLVETYEFFTTRQKLIWKGWCYLDGTEK
ncbi:MAG: hypothetical protein RR406_02565 [Bacilli bacterium]